MKMSRCRAILRIKSFQNKYLGSQSDLCPLNALNRAVAIISSSQSGTCFLMNSFTDDTESISILFGAACLLNFNSIPASLTEIENLKEKIGIFKGTETSNSRVWFDTVVSERYLQEGWIGTRRFLTKPTPFEVIAAPMRQLPPA